MQLVGKCRCNLGRTPTPLFVGEGETYTAGEVGGLIGRFVSATVDENASWLAKAPKTYPLPH